MEQSDSTRKVKPYELATLASRIDPERCAGDPKGAIAAAEKLLTQAQSAIAREEAEKRKEQKDFEERYYPKSIDWAHGIKQITGQDRRERATK
jgi:hypothetical protein